MIFCLQEIHFSLKATQRLRVKGWRKIFQANGNQKKKKGSHTYIKDFKLKMIKKRQGNNDKGIKKM